MEAPEKIYLNISPFSGYPLNKWYKERQNDKDIEYTRTDALVKKVCEWLETNYTEFLDSSRLGINIGELVKDLKNDFKTE